MRFATFQHSWKLLIGLAGVFVATTAVGAEETLFNGRDLEGWKGDPRLWRVEEGVLVGETDDDERRIERNSFLIWQGGELDDFELSMKVRVLGDNNSGVQYRSRVVDEENFVVHGYQMDLHPRQEYNAMLYEEGGRGILCLRGRSVAVDDGGERKDEPLGGELSEVDLSEWNDYRLVAKGAVVEHWLNGRLAARIEDHERGKRSRSGVIALQLHAGPPMRAEFKEINLRRTKSAPEERPGEEASDSSADGAAANTEFRTLPGFELERVYEVPEEQGSWVAMTVDPEGRLIASGQNRSLVQLTPPPIGEPEAIPEVKPLDLPITGAQGLLWAHDALYASVSVGDPGVYRITDSDDDGELDAVDKLQALEGGGEHGPHGLVSSPNGNWIYLVSGNYVPIPEVDHSLLPEVWGEDQLLPPRPDPGGHARHVRAPGGWVVRFTPDGERWELVSGGFRNAYGLAFNSRGDLFTYDSDMEWDFGTPWYRPTRICHVTSGSEFGWRHGTGKWPAYYEDSLPPVLDIGPGSPTGVVSGAGLRFPARYQQALYMLDWTYATIYAVHLTPDGASYTAETEELVAGAGLSATDAVVGGDGALYFVTGGRGTQSEVFRVVYVGDDATAPAANPGSSPKAERLTALRRELEALHEKPDAEALDSIWPALNHGDRFIRYAARVALEHLPPDVWKDRLRRDGGAWQSILAGMALARTGTSEDQSLALSALNRVDPAALNEAQLLNLLRAYGLIFARHGEPDEVRRAELVRRFGPLYPAETDKLNRELCRFLVYLKSPDVLSKTLRLMARSGPRGVPDWAELAARNERYGRVVRQMIENTPSAQKLFYAYCLRTLEGPWSAGQRRQFFTWLSEAERRSGGRSYRGFIADLRHEALERATPEERKRVEEWNLDAAPDPFENLPPVEGPGKNWTVEEVVAAADKGLANRDLGRGKRMFEAALCAACHRFGGEGGGSGPDLTTVGRRFRIYDLVEAIVKPDKDVSDQYRFDVITMKDGSTLRGKIVDESSAEFFVAPSAFDLSETQEVSKESVEKIEPSPTSPMPYGTINRLNEEELRDLLAYLMTRGEE